MEASDNQLITKTLYGDKEAYALLVARYQDRLYNIAFSLLHDTGEAEDVVQETFLNAFVNLGSFRQSSQFYTWLYRIAYNEAIAILRRRKKTPVGSQEIDWDLLDSRLDRPDQRPEVDESIQVLRRGIEQLPPEFRIVLILREFNDASYEEISDVIQVPIGTVRSRLYRARAMLTEKILRSEKEFITTKE